MTNDLTMRWVPVADSTGRTHVEAIWVSLTDARSGSVPAATEHAETAATHAA